MDRQPEKIAWKLQKNNIDYVSEDGKYIAIYYATIKGSAMYLTFKSHSLSRKIRDALSAGGLPTCLPTV